MSDTWLTELTTNNPREGYDLAVKLARIAVKMTQGNYRLTPLHSAVRLENETSTMA